MTRVVSIDLRWKLPGVIIAIGLALLLAACGGDSTATPVPTTATATAAPIPPTSTTGSDTSLTGQGRVPGVTLVSKPMLWPLPTPTPICPDPMCMGHMYQKYAVRGELFTDKSHLLIFGSEVLHDHGKPSLVGSTVAVIRNLSVPSTPSGLVPDAYVYLWHPNKSEADKQAMLARLVGEVTHPNTTDGQPSSTVDANVVDSGLVEIAIGTTSGPTGGGPPALWVEGVGLFEDLEALYNYIPPVGEEWK
jgi:hypothetical protein